MDSCGCSLPFFDVLFHLSTVLPSFVLALRLWLRSFSMLSGSSFTDEATDGFLFQLLPSLTSRIAPLCGPFFFSQIKP